MKYHYPYIRNHKSIKQNYIGSSKIQKETLIPEIQGRFKSLKLEDKTGCAQTESILCHTSITPHVSI